MTMQEYQERIIFQYKWEKMTDEEKDIWIKEKEAEMADIEMAAKLKSIIDYNLLSDDDLIMLLSDNNFGPKTKAVLLTAGCEKEIIGSDEVLCYFGLIPNTDSLPVKSKKRGGKK